MHAYALLTASSNGFVVMFVAEKKSSRTVTLPRFFCNVCLHCVSAGRRAQ